MNKKFLTLFAVFIVAVSMASVCAVELTKENANFWAKSLIFHLIWPPNAHKCIRI